MQSRITIEIDLFGAFRKYKTDAPFKFDFPAGIAIKEIRHALQGELARRYPDFIQQTLILESAFADDQQVLRDNDCIGRDTKLAILPPVCGG